MEKCKYYDIGETGLCGELATHAVCSDNPYSNPMPVCVNHVANYANHPHQTFRIRELKVEITPQELATLRAKADAYGNGHECFGVFDASSQLATISAHPQDNLTNGYTCRKVRVCEVGG